MGSLSRNMAVLLVNSDMKPGFVIRGSSDRDRPPAPITPLDSAIAVTGDSAKPTQLDNQRLTCWGHSGAQQTRLTQAEILGSLLSLGWRPKRTASKEFLQSIFYPLGLLPLLDPALDHLQSALRASSICCLTGSVPPTEERISVTYYRNESPAHRKLKIDSIAFLGSIGMPDAATEVYLRDYGRADVKSALGSVVVEVGTTPACRVRRRIFGDQANAVIIIPYRAADKPPGLAACFYPYDEFELTPPAPEVQA